MTSRRITPWVFALPGLLWLIAFFAIPIVNQFGVSLMSGDPETGFTLTWSFSNYTDSVREYWPHIQRSLLFGAAAAIIDIIIAFPLAYFIAYRAGRWRTVLLLLVMLPFFVSQVLRTVSWQLILNDGGWVVRTLDSVGLTSDGRILATGTAVVAGMAYNFLPFMVLPLYSTLERLDRRLIEAASDLYASRLVAFYKVTLPLAVPGIFAGTLLCFIPASGDFINAILLGSPSQYMIGNVIQQNFLTVLDYPTAAALSFLSMGAILLGIAIYGRLLGTRALTEVAG